MTENSLFQAEGKWGFLDPETLFFKKWGFGALSEVGGIPTHGGKDAGPRFLFCNLLFDAAPPSLDVNSLALL